MTVNTVVIIEAGIGALSLGFAEAGFQIKEVYEKDKKALNIYRNNIGGKICEQSLSELSPENIPDADVIAIDLMEISMFRKNGQNESNEYHAAVETLKKVREIINQKRPPMFCLVMQRGIQGSSVLSDFLEEMSYLRYYTAWWVISSREATGFPITEEQFYMIGSRVSGDDIVSLKYMAAEEIIPIRRFVSNTVEDSWYYELDRENIQENDSKDSFLCWRRDKYVERPFAEWNLIKMPLVRTEGRIHRLTHRETARLKGFPEDFVFELSNKAALYRMLVYAPHVKVVKQIAESLSDSLIQTPLYKMQKADGRKFEEIFSRYLEQKHGTVKSFNEPDEGLDFIYTYKDLTFYFELKIYSSDFAVEQNLHRECRKLIKKEGIGGRRVILAVANLVSDEVKNACKYEYDIFIWDVRNLLWLFEEFPAIKNEFVALLNYTIDAIAPKKPEFYIFEGTEEKSEHPVFEGTEEKSESDELKEKLRKIKPGKAQWRQYEEFCKTMLIYVLGEYLALWRSQENTDNGLYRFDLCCKIKDRVNQDFFNTIRQHFNTKYIVFEFKNNSEKITQKEIYTTEKYLYEKALRKVAIIISRKGADENALAAARGSLRESGKLILCLSDKEVIALINMKEQNEHPTGLFFEAMLDDLLIHLEK